MNDMVTPEAVRDNWSTITDMTGAKSLDSIGVKYLFMNIKL